MSVKRRQPRCKRRRERNLALLVKHGCKPRECQKWLTKLFTLNKRQARLERPVTEVEVLRRFLTALSYLKQILVIYIYI